MQFDMPILLLVWILIGIILAALVAQKRRDSVGLPLAYFLGLSLIHVPGALLYLDETDLSSMATVTRIGFEQTIIGMVAFLFGVMVIRYRFRSVQITQTSDPNFRALRRLALKYLAIGGVSYFIALPVVSGIGTITAVVASLGSLIICAACLLAWVDSKTGNRPWMSIILLPLMPLGTLLQSGFLGFGTYWTIAVLSFFFAQSKRRVWYALFTPVALFVGLSLFVNYMAARSDIRQLVWYEQAGIGDRLQRVVDMFQHFEWFDLSDWHHREAIDSRLNQNWLVGTAMERLDSGQVEYGYGSTIGTMALALIPRAIWPDKPQVGGGGSVVSHFTGIEFGDATSVGAGQVFEFYVNFGTLGIIGGFLLFGCILGQLDLLTIKNLREGDQRRFLLWFLIGLALLQPGNNLLEIEVSAATSGIAAYWIGYLLARRRDFDLSYIPNYRT